MSAARRSSSTARRTLLTATAAGTLLAALWFVPSANAGQNQPGNPEKTSTTSTTTYTNAGPATTGSANSAEVSGTQSGEQLGDATAAQAGAHTHLAATGAFDTTPYVVGGTLFLSLGAGFVVYSVRRERAGLA